MSNCGHLLIGTNLEHISFWVDSNELNPVTRLPSTILTQSHYASSMEIASKSDPHFVTRISIILLGTVCLFNTLRRLFNVWFEFFVCLHNRVNFKWNFLRPNFCTHLNHLATQSKYTQKISNFSLLRHLGILLNTRFIKNDGVCFDFII